MKRLTDGMGEKDIRMIYGFMEQRESGMSVWNARYCCRNKMEQIEVGGSCPKDGV